MGEPRNKWKEPDEHPIAGKWHVRHEIDAARGTGYLFGKNFDRLADALAFCAKQTGQRRLLVHAEGDGWLRIDDLSQFYYVPGTSQ